MGVLLWSLHISKATIFPTMKKLTLATLLIFSCATAWAADFYKGLAAAEAGDFATALTEWKPLAEQGDASVQYNLGLMYDNGEGVIEDDKEAVKWFRLAAEQGYANAQFNLGNMYFNGEGVIEDHKEAIKWYRLAAEQGNANAQANLALMHANGEGVIENNVYAHMWFNIAAANGSENAKGNKDILVKEMTTQDISKAQDLARECVKKNYKDC
jgi:TPR repeat protein